MRMEMGFHFEPALAQTSLGLKNSIAPAGMDRVMSLLAKFMSQEQYNVGVDHHYIFQAQRTKAILDFEVLAQQYD